MAGNVQRSSSRRASSEPCTPEREQRAEAATAWLCEVVDPPGLTLRSQYTRESACDPLPSSSTSQTERSSPQGLVVSLT